VSWRGGWARVGAALWLAQRVYASVAAVVLSRPPRVQEGSGGVAEAIHPMVAEGARWRSGVSYPLAASPQPQTDPHEEARGHQNMRRNLPEERRVDRKTGRRVPQITLQPHLLLLASVGGS
jgi:hypothetical protein